jgi:hypothetical protein
VNPHLPDNAIEILVDGAKALPAIANELRMRAPANDSTATYDGCDRLASGGTRDLGNLRDTVRFARLLAELHIVHRTELLPGRRNWFWQAQLTPALEYAFPATPSTNSSSKSRQSVRA